MMSNICGCLYFKFTLNKTSNCQSKDAHNIHTKISCTCHKTSNSQSKDAHNIHTKISCTCHKTSKNQTKQKKNKIRKPINTLSLFFFGRVFNSTGNNTNTKQNTTKQNGSALLLKQTINCNINTTFITMLLFFTFFINFFFVIIINWD